MQKKKKISVSVKRALKKNSSKNLAEYIFDFLIILCSVGGFYLAFSGLLTLWLSIMIFLLTLIFVIGQLYSSWSIRRARINRQWDRLQLAQSRHGSRNDSSRGALTSPHAQARQILISVAKNTSSTAERILTALVVCFGSIVVLFGLFVAAHYYTSFDGTEAVRMVMGQTMNFISAIR